jgi:hypothetical protein
MLSRSAAARGRMMGSRRRDALPSTCRSGANLQQKCGMSSPRRGFILATHATATPSSQRVAAASRPEYRVGWPRGGPGANVGFIIELVPAPASHADGKWHKEGSPSTLPQGVWLATLSALRDAEPGEGLHFVGEPLSRPRGRSRSTNDYRTSWRRLWGVRLSRSGRGNCSQPRYSSQCQRKSSHVIPSSFARWQRNP